MDAASIADKYVARDGGPPISASPARGAHPQSRQTAETILTLASFIDWHDKGAMWGGYTKEQAFDALCRLTGLPADMLRRIVRGADDIPF